MKTFTRSYTSGAASVSGFANNVTGASWALTATVPTDGLAHLLTIHGDAATDHSAKTAVITGTDENGVAQTETLNLPNGAVTVTSTKYWLSVDTPIAPSATIGADTVDIGWAADAVTPWVDLFTGGSVPQFNVGFGVTITAGSPTYSVQQSYDDVTAFTHATVAAETTNQEGTITTPVRGLRMLFTAAGSVTLTAIAAHL